MPISTFVSLFLVGLLGGVHCLGMCGGIVSALSMGVRDKPWSLLFFYNAGRIASYVAAGALAGALGAAILQLENHFPIRHLLFFIANLMLVGMGLYLLGIPFLLTPIEKIGHHFWKKIQPFTARFLPPKGAAQAFPLGILWGFLPCGLVYSALTTAVSMGSAVQGAMLMLAFGLGTLPQLLFSGFLLQKLNALGKIARKIPALIILGFGFYGFWSLARL